MMTEGWQFSEAVIDKARGYLSDGRVTRDDGVPGVFWVKGGAARRYRVQTDADAETGTATWINCTCAHGLNTGAGTAKCSHAVAVLLATRDRRGLPFDSSEEPGARLFAVTLGDVKRCPRRSLLPTHYRDDGSCRCVSE